ncbi:MAG: hypothetical protein ABI165_07965, partial [Bryobacteraceae bacterium]
MIRTVPSVVLTVSLVLAAGSCRRKKESSAQPVAEEATPTLASTINIADPASAVQFVRGFYAIEAGAWRWTMARFSVVLRPPAAAAKKGATLQFKFNIPETVIARLKPETLNATINGLPLPPQTYTNSGDCLYSRDVPASALTASSVIVDFA